MAGQEEFVQFHCPECGAKVKFLAAWKYWTIVDVRASDGECVEGSGERHPAIDDIVLQCENCRCEWGRNGVPYVKYVAPWRGAVALDLERLRKDLEGGAGQ